MDTPARVRRDITGHCARIHSKSLVSGFHIILVNLLNIDPPTTKLFRSTYKTKRGCCNLLDFGLPARIFWLNYSWVCFRGQGIQW